jgi:hypothetical protein
MLTFVLIFFCFKFLGLYGIGQNDFLLAGYKLLNEL